MPEQPVARPARRRPGVAEGGVTSFDVPPGQLQLRIVVEGPRGQVIDSVSRELTVAGLHEACRCPSRRRACYRGRTVPELQAIRAKADAVPTVDREFRRTERLLIRTDSLYARRSGPGLTARLLNRGGSAMANLPVQRPAGRSAEIDLPLSAFAAGDYLIELNAKTESGTAQELIAFKVGRKDRGSRFAGSRFVGGRRSSEPRRFHRAFQKPVTPSMRPSGVNVNTFVPRPRS